MKINEIFYSLQGEGFFTGHPAVFIRFSGCNLHCPFCDTLHESGREMNEEEILDAVNRYPAERVVLTGGEPSLFVTEKLLERLRDEGKRIAIETNGTHPLPSGIDWITLSPKDSLLEKEAARLQITTCDELKLVFDGKVDPERYSAIKTRHRFLQPCDTGKEVENARLLNQAVEYILQHPEWALSLQTHKIIGIR